MVRKVTVVVAAVLGALCAGPAAAVAHPLLVTAAPAPGALLPGAPSTLSLAFSETAVPAGSAVSVQGPHGAHLSLGPLRAAARSAQLTATLPRSVTPGVYRVHWVALGQDGHTVSGAFAFAVAEKDGSPPPGAAALAAVGQGRGGDGAGEGLLATAARWLGILAAAVRWGGALLGVALRREGTALPDRARPVLLGLALLGAAGAALAVAAAGGTGGLHPGLWLESGTGVSALARLLVALVALAAYRALPRRRSLVLGAAGGLLLAGYGASGHVLAQPGIWPALVMVIHLLAAGAWAGGLLALLLAARSGRVEAAAGARAYAVVAVVGLGAAALTGLISAVREVGHLYFLWHSAYGRLVLLKAGLVLVAAGLGLWAVRRSRGRGLGLEGGIAVAVLALATALAGATQGRGQPLPAQRGDLLPGPALASALTGRGLTPVTLAPARTGSDRFVVTPPAGTHAVRVRLVCGCDVRPVIADLHPVPGAATFAADLPVPTAGTWNAYVSLDGRAAAAPVALPVGVAGAPGAPVRDVLALADLSGPGAARCRSYLTGLELAIGRRNGAGGVDGGSKLALLALDDGGDAGRAAALVAGGAGRGAVAVAPCGAGAEAGAARLAARGVPVLAGDPATGPVDGPRVFRVAGDPYADGVAIAQSIGTTILPAGAAGARTVLVAAPGDAQGVRRLAGLRAGLEPLGAARVRLRVITLGELTAESPARLAAQLSRTATVALVLDGTDAQAPAIAAALARLPARGRAFGPAPVIASERLLSERLIDAAGDAGRLGVVEGTSTVSVDTRDGLTLAQALPALFPGERASLEALRGYVAGLALDDGVGAGTDAAAIAARLHRPAPFTDAIAEPWRADAPAAGAQRLGVLAPQFLSANLIPTQQGGESYTGQYFADGAWERPTGELFGPSLRAPVAGGGG